MMSREIDVNEFDHRAVTDQVDYRSGRLLTEEPEVEVEPEAASRSADDARADLYSFNDAAAFAEQIAGRSLQPIQLAGLWTIATDTEGRCPKWRSADVRRWAQSA